MKIILIVLLLVSAQLFAYDYNQLDMLKEGKRLYYETCISCHGMHGESNVSIQLVVKPRKLNQTILSQEQSYKIIKEGARHWGARADIMPAFKYVYEDEQLQSVAYYISETFNSNRNEKVNKLLNESTSISINTKEMLTRGKKIFKRNCSLCHGITGNGESEYVEQSKASKIFIYPYNLTRTLLDENQIFLYAKFGGYYWGTHKADMPSWKKKYDDYSLKSVAKYIQEVIKKPIQ